MRRARRSRRPARMPRCRSHRVVSVAVARAAALYAIAAVSAAGVAQTGGTAGARESFLGASNRLMLHEGAVEMLHIGGCLLSKDPARAEGLLVSAPLSYLFDREVDAMGSRLGHCVSIYAGAVRCDAMLLRGAIAIAIYIRRFRRDPDFDRLTTSASVPSAWLTQRDRAVRLAVALQEFAGCLTDGDPRTVALLTRAEPDSDGEARALRTLRPRMDPCLAKGVKLNSTVPSFRALLAEALLRKVGGPDGNVQGGGAEPVRRSIER